MRRILESFEEIACRRPEIDGKGFCLGLTVSRNKGFAVVIHDFTYSAEHLVRDLLRLLHSGGALLDDFFFTTIQVLRLQSKYNEKVKPHSDKGNIGDSMTVALGNFEGGALNLGGFSLCVKETPHIYDGHVVHFVEPFNGDRRSLTFFHLCTLQGGFSTDGAFSTSARLYPSERLGVAVSAQGGSSLHAKLSNERHF